MCYEIITKAITGINRSEDGFVYRKARMLLWVGHTHSSLPTTTTESFFVCLFVCVFCPTAVFSQGDILSGTGQTDEIETSPHWLCDYKSTNHTDGGQMRTELTEHPFHSTWWGLCIKDERIQAMAVADLFQNDGCLTGQ